MLRIFLNSTSTLLNSSYSRARAYLLGCTPTVGETAAMLETTLCCIVLAAPPGVTPQQGQLKLIVAVTRLLYQPVALRCRCASGRIRADSRPADGDCS